MSQVQDFLKSATFSYIDAIVLIWLVIGLLRGRKLGMTQELLPMLTWLGVVLVGGFCYEAVSALILQNTGGTFSLLWSRITAYCLLGLGVALFFAIIKKMLGDKLTGSDLFGRSEYYLGMLSGLIRFGCMLLALLAVMNARIVSRTELDAINTEMNKNHDDIHPPRYMYGCIEQAIFTQSMSGRFIKDDMPDILIATVTPDVKAKTEPPKKKTQDVLDSITGTNR